ncbi:MAG: S24/S26 family peptidase [Psychroserpens sp.]|nr:S24/S26 family peptidase [Psychroserpens sp.]
MDKTVDSVILRALDILKDSHDMSSNYQLAQYLDINQSTLSRWYSGKAKTIRYDLWKRKLRPQLEDYIQQAEREIQQETPEYHEAKMTFSHNAEIKVYNESQRIRLNNLYEAIENNLGDIIDASKPADHEDKPVLNYPHLPQKVAAGNGVHDDFIPYGNRPDLALFDVEGDSMSPLYKDKEKVVVHLYQQPVVFGNEFLPMNMVMALIPEDSIIVYERNGEGRAMKRVKYNEGKNTWHFKLTADNEDWAKETNFKRIVRKGDDFKIIGTVLGKLT